jgi:hypothetical protein
VTGVQTCALPISTEQKLKESCDDRDSLLMSKDKFTLVALVAMIENKTSREVVASVEQLSLVTGLSVRSVNEAIKKLECMDLITKVSVGRGQSYSKYIVNV